MVLCASYNLRAHLSTLPYQAGEGCHIEPPTNVPSHFVASKPISLRSPCSMLDELNGSSRMEQLYSPLSSSADSMHCIKSSSSSRSAIEREIERQQRRQLLDTSLLKMRASNNMPLRKHLLVYNTVKQLQRDLDLLDDEELYCNLMGDSCGERMDVDEPRWPFGATSATSVTLSASAVSITDIAQTAPPQKEERRVAEEATSLISEDLDIDLRQDVREASQTPLAIWSWNNSTIQRDDHTSKSSRDLFESIQDAMGDSFTVWSWTLGSSEFSGDTWWTGHEKTSYESASRLEPMWRVAADPLGATNLSRFELQHLFPSQVLLQA
ncbi:hypothetical protein DICVIV_00041 [Dictyocaulus viviparus]|uniref:SERTA domain-containing protein n=1 Tax=Dictyocaulus viviparus TaxID=29172 RepID=A0A0D8Y9T6_DICVI|nr:hypothetical protein DICVIV_00041 [Dictyocaulus viviparus]